MVQFLRSLVRAGGVSQRCGHSRLLEAGRAGTGVTSRDDVLLSGLMLPPRGERVRRPGKGPARGCEDRSRPDPHQEPGRREKGLAWGAAGDISGASSPHVSPRRASGMGPLEEEPTKLWECGEPRFQKVV